MNSTVDLRKKVRIHEALAEALSTMPLRELDFETLFFLLAKLSKSHTDETNYELSMAEFEALTGKKNNIVNYTASFKRLRATTLEIETDKYILIDGLLSSTRLIKGYGVVQVKVSPDMKPFLLNLTQNYTEQQLYSILRLRSKHSKRFYLYFCNFRPRNGAYRTVLEYEKIEDFKEKMGYLNEYGRNRDFIDKVLRVVKKEINELSNIRVSYNLKKRGREFYWIEWYIENKNNEELIKLEAFNQLSVESPKDFGEEINEKAFIISLKENYGLDDKQAEKVALRLDRKMLLESLAKVDKSKKENRIKDSLGGYTWKTLLNDFGTDLNL